MEGTNAGAQSAKQTAFMEESPERQPRAGTGLPVPEGGHWTNAGAQMRSARLSIWRSTAVRCADVYWLSSTL
ncbi:MAG: hypothetical protein HFE60_10630 [Anaerotignum sp.]|nr:hypothetical protein [Anaerotignum sp.]